MTYLLYCAALANLSLALLGGTWVNLVAAGGCLLLAFVLSAGREER